MNETTEHPKEENSSKLSVQLLNKSSIEHPKRSRWRLVGSAIIISIACIDPGNLQGNEANIFRSLF